MAIKSGFYDSLNGDRKYDSLDFGRVFDGVISDGIFANKDGGLRVTHDIAGTSISRGVKVNPGKCWFNHTFVTVDDYELLTIAPPDPVNYRVDTIVVEIDRSPSVRNAFIKVLQGESKPTIDAARNAAAVLKREGDFGCNQYALAAVAIRPNASIERGDILDLRPLDDTGFSVGLVDQIKASGLIDQWTAEYEALVTRCNNTFNNSESARTTSFDTWFNQMKGQLTTDAAGNLQTQVDEIKQKTFKIINPESVNGILRQITTNSCEFQVLQYAREGAPVWIQIVRPNSTEYIRGIANQDLSPGEKTVYNEAIFNRLNQILRSIDYIPYGILNELNFLVIKKSYTIAEAFESINDELPVTSGGSIDVFGNLTSLYIPFKVQSKSGTGEDFNYVITFGKLITTLKPVNHVGCRILNGGAGDSPEAWINPTTGDLKIYAKNSDKLINNKQYYLSMTYVNSGDLYRNMSG